MKRVIFNRQLIQSFSNLFYERFHTNYVMGITSREISNVIDNEIGVEKECDEDDVFKPLVLRRHYKVGCSNKEYYNEEYYIVFY